MIYLAIIILTLIILMMILGTLLLDQKRQHEIELHKVMVRGFWDGSNRRTVERINVSLDVKCYANGDAAHTQSVDMSTKGIRLLLDERFERGIPLRLEIRLPVDDYIIKASGEVMWTSESFEDGQKSGKRLFNTGIKFRDLHKTDEKKLFDFINTLVS